MKKLMTMVSRGWKSWARKIPVTGILAVLGFQSLEVSAAGIGSNLFANGSFDKGLEGWQYKYSEKGESWYFDNDKFISILARDGGQVNVLSMKCNYDKAMVPGQGVLVDSHPIPIDLSNGARYRLTVSARTTAPDCRIYLQGFSWKPGIKPHDKPDIYELRRQYKFAQVFFNGRQGGDFGGVNKSWDTATMTFPDPKMTDLAKTSYEKIKFVSLHVVAIGASGEAKNFQSRDDCYLYVDDIKLERIK